MNPQLAKAAAGQASAVGDTRASAEEAGYMELDGAQKDSDCATVNVPGGVSSGQGCCNLWDRTQGAQNFSCGTCTKIKAGAAGGMEQEPDQDDNAGAEAADTTNQSMSASPQSPS